LHRRVSRKRKGAQNRRKAVRRLARGHLTVSRQHKDFAAKTARTLIQSHDLVAYEDLKIANLIRNRQLAKSISDAAWGRFLGWLRAYGGIAGVPVVAVPPAFTSQDCSGILPDGTPCQARVWKALSMRTHVCPRCGLVLDRDANAARNILHAAQALLVAASPSRWTSAHTTVPPGRRERAAARQRGLRTLLDSLPLRRLW
jgi:putative transposase